ncbi:MAG: hypothetical protein KAI47_26970, partial [Deltaproteobacteria bacterium]|nr:hypothetical protein [Deltaproteobacteria bacterium]
MKRNAKRWGHLLRSLLPDGAYALATVFLFADVYFLGARFFARDLLHLFYPTAEVLGAALRGKSSLLWDPSTFHGMPLLATWTPGVFYPPNWLNALLSAPDTFAFLIIAHLILAAAALRRLALCFTENRWAAWLAGFGYAFGGYMLSMKGNGFYLFAGALLPWAVLAFVRLMRCPSLSQMLQLIPVLVLQFFVGDVQTLYYQVLLLFPAIFLLDLNRANWRPRLGWAALGGALA